MSKNTEKKICEYIQILEKLIFNIMENSEIKSNDINRRIDKLRNILSKRGITPEEIEEVLELNKPYDDNLEQSKIDLVNENLPNDLNSEEMFQQPNFREMIYNFIQKSHFDFEKKGIYLNNN